MYERKIERYNKEIVHEIDNRVSLEESRKDQEEFNERMKRYNYDEIDINIPF